MEASWFRNRLAQLRISRDLSARQVSLQLGKGQNYVRDIESGQKLPSLQGFFEICDFFGVTPSEFFSDEPFEDVQLYREIKALDDKQVRFVKTVVEALKQL